ncbi:MAG: LON peptidase substrate-binding domain-containing protein [Parvibaculales bacterium]
MFKKYAASTDLPETLPVFPLSGSLLLPRVVIPLNIFEPRYLKMIDDTLSGHRLIGMVQPNPELPPHPDGQPVLNRTACAGRITSYMETDDGRMLISLTGVSRFKIVHEIDAITPYRQVAADFAPYEADLVQGYGMEPINRTRLLDIVRNYLDTHELSADWDSINNSTDEELVNSLSVVSPFSPQEKQALLEAESLTQRADILIAFGEIILAQSRGEPPQIQ